MRCVRQAIYWEKHVTKEVKETQPLKDLERIKMEFYAFCDEESGNDTTLDSLKQIEKYLNSELESKTKKLKKEKQDDKNDSDEGTGGPSVSATASGTTSNDNLPENSSDSNFRSLVKNILLFLYCQLIEFINFIYDYLFFF